MKLGWRKDPHDPRDHSASGLFGTGPVPASSSNGDLILSILSQTNQDCTANGVAQAIRANHVLQGVQNPPLLSRRMLYRLTRNADNLGDADEGAYIRSCFSVLNKIGFCPEEIWPYDKPVNANPNLRALRAAYDQKAPTSYKRIFETGSTRVDVVKRALAARHLVTFGTQIAKTFGTTPFGIPLDPPVGQPWAGGHCMTAVDHAGDAFRIVNSWGETWGNAGFILFSADYIKWSETNDLWIVEKAARYSA